MSAITENSHFTRQNVTISNQLYHVLDVLICFSKLVATPTQLWYQIASLGLTGALVFEHFFLVFILFDIDNSF